MNASAASIQYAPVLRTSASPLAIAQAFGEAVSTRVAKFITRTPRNIATYDAGRFGDTAYHFLALYSVIPSSAYSDRASEYAARAWRAAVAAESHGA